MGEIIRDVLTPKDIMEQFAMALNQHQVDRILEFIHPEYNAHLYLRADDAYLQRRGELSGIKDIERYWVGIFEDYPNFAVEELGCFEMNDTLAIAGYHYDFGDGTTMEAAFIIEFEECASRLLIRRENLISWDPPPR